MVFEKIHSGAVIALVLAFGLAIPSARADDSKPAKQVATAQDVLQQMIKIPETGIPPRLLNQAEGIAIVPDAIKVGFVLAGQRGHGILFVRGDGGHWRNPVFITLTSGSIGWQAGAQSTDYVLVFKHRSSVEDIAKGQFTLGADASVAAGPVGRNASAATNIKLKSEVYSYSRSRGLFAGVALNGTALQIDYSAIEQYYHRSMTPQAVFAMPLGSAPSGANSLRDLLDRIAPRGG